MANLVVRVILVSFLVGSCFGRKIPDNVKTCPRSSKDFEKCFAGAITDILPLVKDGFPEMGIHSLEPVHLPLLYLDSGTGGSFAFDINGTDVEFHGITSLDVRKAKLDVENNLLSLTFHVPILNVTSHYRSKGKILVIAIDGEGDMFFNFHDLVLTGEWDGTRTTKKGKEYYNFKEKKFGITVGEGSNGHFGNLFKNNPELTDATNKVFNENFNIAFNEFKPTIDVALSMLTTRLINSVHERFPIDTLYPA